MKKQEWTAGLDHIDPALVEQYVKQREALTQKKRKRSFWLRAGAVAACLALILGAVIIGPMLNKDNDGPTVPIVHLQAPSSAPKYYGSESAHTKTDPTVLRTGAGLSVTAQFLEALPDIYTFYGSWDQDEFRLVRMKTIKLLAGKEMTDEFYYLFPVDFMTDFSLFDCFVIQDMAQFTYEYSVIYNKTQTKAEQLNLVIFGYFPNFTAEKFKAFDSEGKFDERLWKATEAWTKRTQYASVVETITEEEENARDNPWGASRYVHLLKDVSTDAATVLSQIKAFKNGLYVQEFTYNLQNRKPEVQFQARRYINGFATNEMISIYGEQGTEQVTFTKARFDEQDMASLPDLTSAFYSIIDALENGALSPPNIQATILPPTIPPSTPVPPNIQPTITLRNDPASSVFAWYAKTEDGVIGVVRVSWRLNTQHYETYFDDAYFIVEYGSLECQQISRDDLLELLGEYETTYIYTGEYYEYGKDLRGRDEY